MDKVPTPSLSCQVSDHQVSEFEPSGPGIPDRSVRTRWKNLGFADELAWNMYSIAVPGITPKLIEPTLVCSMAQAMGAGIVIVLLSSMVPGPQLLSSLRLWEDIVQYLPEPHINFCHWCTSFPNKRDFEP
ncbi:hypothetical protein NDU88_010334 [Pleurodeles waltl]|uniref:Uncharacterized protein n=1 Tax=Pleurodeles waltl TaxID=8319 RepID=A0AAV7PYI5_PLEWA|nr:hypothetical protein NDU88_010334 [Pleurodeles waltl]